MHRGVAVGVVAVAAALTIGATPAGALPVRGVAVLQTDGDLDGNFHGGVGYVAKGSTENRFTMTWVGGAPWEDGRLSITDDRVLIIPEQESAVATNCTGGVGAATCSGARWFNLLAGAGDDEITIHGSQWTEAIGISGGDGNDTITVDGPSQAFVDCGTGFDRVTLAVDAYSFADSDCEVVLGG